MKKLIPTFLLFIAQATIIHTQENPLLKLSPFRGQWNYIETVGSADADIFLKEGNIDLLLCGPNPDNSDSPFYSEKFGPRSNFNYRSALIRPKKSDPGLIAWMNMHGRISHIILAIELLNEETS